MSWADGIGGTHLAIAKSTARRIGVLAGPGTGKTTLGLMRRLARLLTEGVDPRRLLLVSFTRVAAADLRDKVTALGVPGAERVRGTTLHAFCLSLLQREAVLATTGRSPRILLQHEVDLLLRDLQGSYGNIYQRRKRLRAFQAGWARRTEDHPGTAMFTEDRAFEAQALEWLRRHRAMLIGEVVPLAHQYLVNNPAADELGRYDHVIVDEYQDLNRLEQDLLDVLTERPEAFLCTAGDDDQSIYSMKYANPDGILKFIDQPGVERHTLTTCGRCPKTIVGMANALMKNAPGRAKPDLDPLDERSAKVAIIQWGSLDEEVTGLVEAIAKDVQQQRREAGDIMVLTNRRLIGEPIRDALRELDIPAQSYFQEEELDTDEAREAFALLQLAVDPDDRPALRVILGIGAGDARAAAYARLVAIADEQRCSPRDVLENLVAGKPPADLRVPSLVGRYQRAKGILDSLDRSNLTSVVERLFPSDVPYLTDLRDMAVALVPELNNLPELLDRMTATITQDDIPQTPNFVRIMSLHKSKGLTSPVVFIVGAVDGILPTIGPDVETEAELAQAIAEQRRLFYVAITRAAEQLVISSATVMTTRLARRLGVRFGKTWSKSGERVSRALASPYLNEIRAAAPKAIRGTQWLDSY